MTRSVLAALLLLGAVGPVFAQAGEPKPAPTRQDADAAYQDLARALNKSHSEWQQQARQAVQDAQAAGREMPAVVMQPPTKAFIDRAAALAQQYVGTDDAVPFLAFVCKNASDENQAVQQAVSTLLADHARSAAITGVLDHLDRAFLHHGAAEQVMALYERVIADNPHADCKAQALLVRGNLRLHTATTDAQRAAATADLRRVATVTDNEDLRQLAKDALFEIEHLQIGCVAPDIVAKDTEGLPCKLSDYRGKVVLLDFWGFW